MDNVNIVIMGKTGAGKSTLINVILGEEKAPTGIGQHITIENKVYSKNILLPFDEKSRTLDNISGKTLNLYDTVGLEVDNNITQKTLMETKSFLKQTSKKSNDITLVWFCVSQQCSRLEDYELELIKKLSLDFEIPFILVITQCLDKEKSEFETQIETNYPEITIKKVLAQKYKLRGQTAIPPFGTNELIEQSINDYNKIKINVLESKLNQLDRDRKSRIQEISELGKRCIESYSDKATKIGFIPGGCIPFVHGLCIKLIMDLNKIVGINASKDFASEIFANTIIGIFVTPFMVIPLVSAGMAYSYVETVGDSYLDALMKVVELSTDTELNDNELMTKKIKAELKRRKN